jgi:hypothetical protein
MYIRKKMGFCIKMNRCMTYFNETFATLQIEGGESQLDFLSCWHDNGNSAIHEITPVVGGEVARLDNTIARWRHIGAHIATGFAPANDIDRRVNSRDI